MRVKYSNEENTLVDVAKDDINFNISGLYEDHPKWEVIVQPWLDEGNTIELYIPPTEIKTWSTLEFLKKFTQQERKSIKQAAKNDEDLDDFMLLLTSSSIVVETDTDLIAGMGYLVTSGQITQERHDEIMEV